MAKRRHGQPSNACNGNWAVEVLSPVIADPLTAEALAQSHRTRRREWQQAPPRRLTRARTPVPDAGRRSMFVANSPSVLDCQPRPCGSSHTAGSGPFGTIATG